MHDLEQFGQLLHFVDHDRLCRYRGGKHLAQPLRPSPEPPNRCRVEQIDMQGVGVGLLGPPSLAGAARPEQKNARAEA